MGEDDMPMDDKAKRMRDLLSSFYSPDPSVTNANNPFKFASLDVINTTSFDADQYMNLLVQRSNLEGLLQKHVEMAAEIKNLDTDLQMLVYENYNKFISATDTIKRMKTNIVGMETNMEQLLDKIMTVQSRSDGVNTSLFEKREHIEKLHRTRNLLRKVQFIYDLPARLGKCIKSEAYADAVRFYIGAMPIFKAYGDSSFQDCKRASEEAMDTIIKNLQGKLFSDSESIQARAEAAVLLKQLDFPVDSLKAKLFEKLEQSLDGLQLTHEEIANVTVESSNLSEQGNNTESIPGSAHGALVSEFAEAVRAYQVIFPDSEKQLIKLSQDLITKHFEITSDFIKKWIPIANFLGVLRIIWKDVLLIDKVSHEALLPDYSSKASRIAVRQYIKSTFSHLLHDISDTLTNVHIKPKEEVDEHPLVVFLEAGKSSVLQGSMNVLLDFRQLLKENLGGLQLSDLIVDWVQEGFQDFFRALHDQFLLLSGKNKSAIQDENSTKGMQVEKVVPGLVLVLAQLSIFIEQTAISRITEEIAAYFSGGGGGALENGPAFVPGEICRTFHSAGEILLQHYINMRTQKITVLLRKRFTAPNWVKHKEPREVHMFVDLFLQELEAIGTEAKQILPHGVLRKHRRSESNGSSASSRSNSLRDDKMSRSNTHRARSQLLEKHLAKLFKQKVEIFTKTEYTQESVVTAVVKLCLKSLQEYVRLQTFNRSGFQQIQLDVQFLRASLKEIVEDEAAVDFLLIFLIEAENIAGFPKHTWQSLIGASLSSYFKCGKKFELEETSKVLRLAKTYKSSSQVLSAVADYLDHVHGSTLEADTSHKTYHPEFEGKKAVDAFDVFADNLCSPDKGIRVPTLRILCHYEPQGCQMSAIDQPPEKKMKTEFSETCPEDSQSIDVLQLLLSIEATTLSISTSRKVVLLISRIQMGLSAGRIAEAYIPILLSGMIGIFHNRFSYQWASASECLAVLIGKHVALAWDKFVCYLEHCQSVFHMFHDKPGGSAELSDQSSDLAECSFVTPVSDSTPCATVLSSLLQTLQKIPSVAESRSRQIIPLFLKFLGYNNNNLASVGLFNPVTCKGKEWKGILKEWLNLLKLMRNSKAFYQNQFVKDVLQTRLIDEDDVHIQTSVLDCLLTWKDDFLLQYEQHLRNLISSNHVREELITWSLSRESAVIEEGHRANLVPLVILLLMPKVRKLKMLASRKHTSINQRKVVLRFIAQLDVGELTLFFLSLLKPLHILPEGVDSAAIFFWNLCKSSVDEFQTSNILKHFTMEKIMALSWKQRTGLLHVVEDILGVFDESRTRPFLDLLMGCVVRLLGSCTASLDAVKDTSSVVEDNTSDNQKLHENNNAILNQVARSTAVKQFKDMRSLCLRIVSLVLNKYDDHDFGDEFWELFFKSVKPLIDSFKQEGSSSEKPSSLFSCFLAMSRSSHLVPLLFREQNLAPNIFSILTIPTASEAIISCVLKFIENLLNLEDDLDDEDNAAQKLLLLNLDELINSLHHLFQSDKATKRYPGEIQIRIFKFLSKYIKDQLPARQLVDILLSSLAMRYKDSDVCIEYLQVVRDIIPVVGSESGSKILKAVSPLLTSVGLDVRLPICDLLDALAKSDPSFLFVAKLLHELNATSATEMGGLDYDTVFKAYEKVGVGLFYTIPVDQALVILSHCVYDMSSVDITLRHCAYSSLLSFVEFSSAILCGEDQNQPVITNCEGCWTRASIQRTINKFLLKYMGNAMKARSSVRKEWIELLRDMVLKLPKVAKFSSFKALCSEDAEVDFFNNIIHLQKRMIARALLRFKTVISESTASEDILNKIFVPLFFNMLLEEQGGKGEHIKSACLEALASISALMEWKSYYNLLIRCFQEMNVHLDKQKILLRLICSILDQFHFSQICSSQEVKDPPDSSLADTSDSCSMAVSRKCVGGTSSAMVHKNGTSVGLSEILACLHKTVLPKIQQLLDSDSDKVNANISVAALKVLKLLPGDTIDSQLPSIIHRIANQLKSRMESIRDEARLALSACLKELGLEYLQFIVRVLRATLKRGYELHVLGYSLNFILSKFLSGPVCGKLDYCLQDLLSAVENDILGDVAEEKEVEKLASKMKETRKQKSFETLKMIAQNITFKTHALKLLSPVTTHMLKHLTPKVKPKLESMLNHIAAGIEHNPSADQTDLFIFIYGLIEDWIKEENGSFKNSSGAVAKLHSRADASQKTVSSGRVVGTKSVCSHLIAVFALRLFQNHIKRVKMDKNAEQLLSMLDPFVELLGNCLISNYEDILSASLTCLTPLVRLPLPSLPSQADRIKVTLLDIAQSSVKTSSPLMQSCLRLLIALLWSTNVTLSSEQLHLLIEFPLFVDLERNPSFIALSLLKAIVNRKLVVPQMYDLAIRVAELMVTSQVESIRKKCSQILLKFLLHYRLSKKNLQQHLDFLLNNLSYEHSTGREAALEMLHAIIIKCGKINIEEFNSQEGSQKKFLEKHGQSLFIHLVQCLANDSDNKVRLMTGAVIKLLIRHISSDGFNSIMDFILSWYMDEKQNLQSLGAQTMGLPVEICLDMKEEVERMKEEVKGMKEEVEDMLDKIGVLTRKAEAMEKEIEDKSKRIEGLKEEVKGMEEEVEVLAKKDKVMKEDIEDKKKNVKDKSAKIEGIERKIEVTKKKIEVLKKSLEKYIHSALPVSKKILQSAVKVVASEPLLDHSDAAIPFWKEAYYSLVMLEKILNCFHDLCFERDLEDIWEAICELLLHPHTWLRNVSSRLVAFYFASANKAIKQDREKSLGMLFLMRPSRVFMIAVSLCYQLETEVIDDAMSNLITHNLATASFTTHILMGRMECVDPCIFWSALDQHEQGQFLEAFQLLDTRKGRGMLLHMVSGVRRHDNVNQSDNLQYFLVSNLLKKMGDIALIKDAIQMETVFNCFKEFVAHFSKEEKEFAAHINQDDCQHYAFDMLLPLYKVCEGFAGKVVPDNLKQLAQEVCDRIRKVIGMENFVQVYSNIRTNIKVRREKRKREGKVMAVTNPVRHAKRKLQVAAKNRAHKKRKIMTMKMKMGRWTR